MKPVSIQPRDLDDAKPLAVSLGTLALRLDAHRSSVRRWLRHAGVRPISMSDAKNGAIRYRWADVEHWLATRDVVD